MEIQNVTIEDAEELLDIYAPYVKYTAITFEYDVPSVEEFRQRIVNISNRYPYIKAVDNGQIVGYAYAGCFKDRRAYDWSVETTIYVRQDCKRMGIGRLLYDRLEHELKSMGILNMNACIACPNRKASILMMTVSASIADWDFQKLVVFMTVVISLTSGSIWCGWRR